MLCISQIIKALRKLRYIAVTFNPAFRATIFYILKIFAHQNCSFVGVIWNFEKVDFFYRYWQKSKIYRIRYLNGQK